MQRLIAVSRVTHRVEFGKFHPRRPEEPDASGVNRSIVFLAKHIEQPTGLQITSLHRADVVIYKIAVAKSRFRGFVVS